MDAAQILRCLAQFTGSETLTHYPLVRGLLLTEGVCWLASSAEAHWLIDAIASHQLAAAVRREEFQCWRLQVSKGKRGVLTMTNGNNSLPVAKQIISTTDFPLGEITLWVVAQGRDQVMMLPSEY